MTRMGGCVNEEVEELPDLRNSALVTLVLAMVTLVLLYTSAEHKTRVIEVILGGNRGAIVPCTNRRDGGE